MSVDLLVGNVSLDGFQIVNGSYFVKQQPPQMSLWKNAVQFNTMAYLMLSRCERIRMLLNTKTRQILVQPCNSKDQDAIAWLKNPDDPKMTRIACESFTRQLFDGWNWDDVYHYRTNGCLVKNDDRLMLLFDFRKPEIWNGLKMVKTVVK